MTTTKAGEEPTEANVARLSERARALGYELLTDGRARFFHLRHTATDVWPACWIGAGPEDDGRNVAHGFDEIDAWLTKKEQVTSEGGE
jgi:hypothetical protein